MKEKKNLNLVLFITALLFLGMFIGNYGNYQLSAVPGSVYQAYSLTDVQFSSIMTAPMFPSIFLSIIIGILVDRFGISKMVSICYVIAAAGFVFQYIIVSQNCKESFVFINPTPFELILCRQILRIMPFIQRQCIRNLVSRSLHTFFIFL